MTENKTKKDRPPIRVESSLKRLIEVEASRLNVFEYELVDRMWQAYAAAAQTGYAEAPYSGNSPLTIPDIRNKPQEGQTDIPPKDLHALLARLPEEVLSLIRNHWGDPKCRECVSSIACIWDVGDPDIMDSLHRNCRTFRRSSEWLKQLQELKARGIQIEGSDVGPNERRSLEMLGVAEQIEQENSENTETPRRSPRGRKRGPGVGK